MGNISLPEQSSASRDGMPVSLLDLPSATTAVFVLIVVMTLSLFVPIGASGLLAVISTGLPLILFLASLRLFLTMPERWRARNDMLPLVEIDPDLDEWARKQAEDLGIGSATTFLYTEQPAIPLQAFGTFRQHFVVINKAEVDALKGLGALPVLKTMLSHELAHLKSGDTWKLQLAKQIIKVSSVLLLVLFAEMMISRFSLERLLLSGPVGRADLIATVLSFTLILGVMLYSLSVMQRVREYYADAWVLRAQGSEAGARNLAGALMVARHLWATVPSTTVKPTSWRSRLAGVTFTRTPQEESLSRLKAIAESRTLGAPFLQTMRQVAFAGGLAVGTQLFAFDTGTQLLFAGIALGGAYVGLAYLLPCMTAMERTPARLAAQAVAAAGVFMAGVTSFGLLRVVIVQVIYGLSGVYRPILTSMLQGDLRRFIPLAACALALSIALVSVTPVIRWWQEPMATGKNSRGDTLALFLIVFAQSVCVFAVTMMVTAAAVHLGDMRPSDAWGTLWPIVILLPLGICLTISGRWLALRRVGSGRQKESQTP